VFVSEYIWSAYALLCVLVVFGNVCIVICVAFGQVAQRMDVTFDYGSKWKTTKNMDRDERRCNE